MSPYTIAGQTSQLTKKVMSERHQRLQFKDWKNDFRESVGEIMVEAMWTKQK